MPSRVGRTRGKSRAGSSTAKAESSLAPVASRTFPCVRARNPAAWAAEANTMLPAGSGLSGRSRRRYSVPAVLQAARMFRVASTAYGWVASTQRSAPCSRAVISSGVSRPQWTVMPDLSPCSSAPSGVATLTSTSAPSAASCFENTRPSVVPLNTTALMRGTPAA